MNLEFQLDQFVNRFINKMEIGACRRPLCDENTIFIDRSITNLNDTISAIKERSHSADKATFIHANALSIPVKSSSVDCLVSSYFSWRMNDDYKEILKEWKRVIHDSGFIIIVSSIGLIGEVLESCNIKELGLREVFRKIDIFCNKCTIILRKKF
jgi:ubiquinone/menaquinone biosynthesis C-methylase UbiE